MSGSTESTLKVPLMRTKLFRAVHRKPKRKGEISRSWPRGLRSYQRETPDHREVGRVLTRFTAYTLVERLAAALEMARSFAPVGR